MKIKSKQEGSSGPGGPDRFGDLNSPEFLARLTSRTAESRKAFRFLVEKMHGPLTSFSYRLLSSPEEVQEVLQEVYLGIYKGIGAFGGKSKLTTWIYGLAHHKICDRLSDRHRRFDDLDESLPSPIESDPLSLDIARGSAWDLPPDKLHLQGTLRELITLAITRLPPSSREIYHLRDIEGLTGDEVAEVLDISEAAVRVRLHRARNQIVEIVKSLMARPRPAHLITSPVIGGEA